MFAGGFFAESVVTGIRWRVRESMACQRTRLFWIRNKERVNEKQGKQGAVETRSWVVAQRRGNEEQRK